MVKLELTRKNGPAPLSERGIIAAITARFPGCGGEVLTGLGDDAAVLRLGGAADGALRLNSADTLATADLLIEGVHFSRDYMSLADIGYKALAVNLSDIAAMGGAARYALGVLGVPRGTAADDVAALLDGVAKAAQTAGVALIGGDTVVAPQWVIGFTVLGEIKGAALKRSGARPGDTLWHSGALGLSQTGLSLLWGGADAAPAGMEACLAAHRRPQAQLALGRMLQERGLASACLDTSDSLAQCALLLAEASGVGLMLDFAQYPFAPEIRAFAAWLTPARALKDALFRVPAKLEPAGQVARYRSLAHYLLASSEDFQLLFTAPPQATPALLRLVADPAGKLKLTRLGSVVDALEGCHWRDEQGRMAVLEPLGFSHLG